MLKQQLQLKLTQKLSPQQIQLMKLVQLPTVAFEQRVKEELDENPALEPSDNENWDEEEDYEDPFDTGLMKLSTLVVSSSLFHQNSKLF